MSTKDTARRTDEGGLQAKRMKYASNHFSRIYFRCWAFRMAQNAALQALMSLRIKAKGWRSALGWVMESSAPLTAMEGTVYHERTDNICNFATPNVCKPRPGWSTWMAGRFLGVSVWRTWLALVGHINKNKLGSPQQLIDLNFQATVDKAANVVTEEERCCGKRGRIYLSSLF